MPAGFTKSMADRLNEVSDIHVKEAEDGDVLKKGTIYIAPGGKHMEIKKSPDGARSFFTIYCSSPGTGLLSRQP